MWNVHGSRLSYEDDYRIVCVLLLMIEVEAFTGLFTKNDAKALTLLFLNETEFFNLCKYLLDIYSPYGYLGAENLTPVWHSGAGKQDLKHPLHMA